jgi:hypothetical protein
MIARFQCLMINSVDLSSQKQEEEHSKAHVITCDS